MLRLLALAFTVAFLAVSRPMQAADPSASAEFPPQDASLTYAVNSGAAKTKAAELLSREPAAVDTVRALARAGDMPGILKSLRLIVDRYPERIADAFEVFRNDGLPADPFGSDSRQVREQQETMRSVVADAGRALTSRSREEQARAERMFPVLASDIVRDRQQWAAGLQQFVEKYRGTETALLTEVDLASAADGIAQRLDQLDAFVQQHPGTVAAAKALYLKGFDLHTINTLGPVYPSDGDPIERFRRVQEVVRELESGKYPASEWVSKAPSLIVSFFISDRMRVAPASIDEMAAAFQEFAAAHFDPAEKFSPGNAMGYVVTSTIGGLYARRGERVVGVERVLDALERRVSDPSGVRLLRGLFYLQRLENEPAAEYAARVEKGRQVLRALATEGQSIHHRRALATLAALDVEEGKCASALALLRRYVKTYPSSGWTWVARLRIGQCLETQGITAAATAAYLEAAREHPDVPMARVLGAAYAARLFQLSGELSKAVGQYQRALQGWDNAYGLSYTTYVRRSPVPGDPFVVATDTALVQKETLAPRIAELKRMISLPGGAIVERARTMIAREQFEAAAQLVTGMLAQNPKSPIAAEARGLIHRAQIEAALRIADVHRADPDEQRAMAIVEAVAKEPHDFGVFAARIMRSTLLLGRGRQAEAEATLGAALADWHKFQPLRTPANPLEEDVAAIRQAVFLPRGGGVYAGGWNGFSWPTTMPAFLVVNADVPVRLHNGEAARVTLGQRLPEAANVLFFDTEQLTLLSDIIVKLGGTRRAAARQVLDTPNQPVGDSTQIIALWNRFFPARPGHWGGWVLETYPQVTQIQFANAERTKASARVTIGYSGGVVELEKEGGRWIPRRLTGQWIT